MSGYFPSINYDPTNPTAWNNKNYSAPPQMPPSQSMYGPIRAYDNRPNYMPNINAAPRYNEHRSQSTTNLYVSGFPANWNAARLRKVFEPFGILSEVKVITKTGSSFDRGAAFVHYAKSSDAAKAVDALKTNLPEECTTGFVVRFANSGKNSGPDQLRSMRVALTRSKPEGFALESSMNVYISQLPSDITEEKVRSIFEKFGVIKTMKVSVNTEKGSVAFVHYESPMEALKAVVEMDEKTLEDTEPPCPISVRFANINNAKRPPWFTLEHLKNMQSTCNVYVTQIPHSWTEQNLTEFFADCGKITEIKILSKKDNVGGVAFVHFDKSIGACKAVLLKNDHLPFEGAENNILVTFARMDNITYDRLVGNTLSQSSMGGGQAAYNGMLPQQQPMYGGGSYYPYGGNTNGSRQ